MTAAWKQLTLQNFSPTQWRKNSYLYRLIGFLGQWRQGSWLMQWSEPLGALLVSLILGIAPFVSTSQIGVLLIAAGTYWFLLTLSEDRKVGTTPIHLLVLLYWGIATIAVAFSPVRTAAFAGWTKLTLYMLFFALASRILRSPRLTNWILTVFLLTALVVSVYGIQQQILGVEPLATWNDPTSDAANDTRVYSYLENPNLLASYLLPAIALSIAAVFVWQGLLPKLLAVTMVFINSACLYFTDSRGGWIGMMALIVTFLLLLYYWFRESLSPFWQKWLLPIVLGGFGLFLLVAIIGVEPLRLRVLSIFAGRGDSSNNFRLNVWDSVIEMIEDHPLLGIGPGNVAFNKMYPLYMKPKFTALSAYSIYLETALETGIIGFTCFIWFLVVTFNQGVRQVRRLQETANLQAFWLMAAIAGMAGILTHGLVDTVWYRPQISTLWWLLIALIASRYPISQEADSL